MLLSSLLMNFGLLATLLGGAPPEPLHQSNLDTVNLMATWESPWLQQLSAADPAAETIVQQYLKGLSETGLSETVQGIWVQTNQYALAQHLGDVPLPAASLTKVATTLAALATWPPDHQFETLIGMTGSLEQGVLNGDLVIQGSGDPLFVWEEAIVLGNALEQLGIRRVTGNLVIHGNFAMNFDANPTQSGQLLKVGLNANLWTSEAWAQYNTLPPNTAQPQLLIEGTVIAQPAAAGNGVTWLVRHQSLPLVAVLKAMNIYSNNAMAEMVAQTVGGPAVIKAKVVEQTGLANPEIALINGSGLGEENQISPRGVATSLRAIQVLLQKQGYSVADVLPVFGQDVGTLVNRQLPAHAALKTGSLAQVSSLAGVFPTRDRGLVWFAILNRGQDLDGLRLRQDQLLAALESHWGKAPTLPEDLVPKVQSNQVPYQLGNPERNSRFN